MAINTGTEQAGSASGAAAQAMAGFVRVGIANRVVSASATVSEVPELILGDGLCLRLPKYALERLLDAMIARIDAGAR